MNIFKDRYIEVLYILVKYGFDEFISNTPLKELISKFEKPKKRFLVEYSQAERIRMSVEELGPTYIKFAQILSTRPDVIPRDLLEEFVKLQDEVAPVKMDAKKIIEESLGKPCDDIFEQLDKEPFASASTAQVYKGQLKTGETVAVKILKPGIREKVKSDISILKDVAGIVSRYSEDVANMKPLKIITVFEEVIQRELNYRNEATNIERFRGFFQKEKEIYIPEVYHDFSSKNILCLEYIDAVKISKVDEIKESGKDIEKIVREGVDFYMRQIFKSGFYHADPHPGNIFITKDTKICLIDYGMMGELLSEDKDMLGKFIVNLFSNNLKTSVQLIKRIAVSHKILNDRELEYDLHELINQFNLDLKDIDMRDLLDKLQNILFKNQIELPRHYFLLIRTLGMLEGLGRRVYPRFNLIEQLEPHTREMAKDRYSPKSIKRRLMKKFNTIDQLVDTLPDSTYDIIEKLKSGELKFSMEHKGLESTEDRLDKISNRITLALILGSLIIGSSMLLAMEVKPYILGISAFGIVGFGLSGLIGLFMIYMIIRRKGF